MKQNGMLKHLSKLSFFHPTKIAMRQRNLENGRKIQEARLDIFEKAQAERLEVALNKMKKTWSDIGYNKEEVLMLEEAWAMTTIKNKETYQADKKQAKKLIKDAADSLAARNTK